MDAPRFYSDDELATWIPVAALLELLPRELDAQLRSMGLMPLQVVQHRTWPLAPTQWADPWEHDSRQVVESDVLYVRDPAGLAVRDLAVLALVGDIGYRHRGLARRCLRLLDECGRGDLEAQYVSRLGRHYG